MTRWLCIETTFLSGRYHGQRRGGQDAEWPPAPHRLFQALLAAAHLGTRTEEWSEAKASAFRWLEERDPPEIAAPRATPAAVLTLSVPNNDMDVVAKAWARGAEPTKQPSALRTMKTLRPQLVDGDARVRFLWPIREDEWQNAQPHAEVLCEEARHLHHLGLGIDLVAGAGRILDDAAKRALLAEIYLPDPAGRSTRVPVGGSFDELVERHAAFLRRVAGKQVDPPTPPARVRWVRYRRRAEGRVRSYFAFRLVQPSGAFASFEARKAAHVAAWLRHAAHETAKRLMPGEADFIEGFVCGHGKDAKAKAERFSYLPLPSIRHGHVDGRIRRALLVEPFGDSDGRARSVVRALADEALIDEEGEVRAELRGVPTEGLEGDLFEAYLNPATTWGSVTPVILPGLDDKRSCKAVGLIAKALAQAGYATPVAEISVQAEPVFAGAEMALRYVVPEHLKRWPRVHAIIRFAEALPGPIAIGRGRHGGLGVFAALSP